MSDRMTLKLGQAAAIEVPFAGFPKPKVTWTYNGGKMPDARRFKVDTIIGMSSLTMSKVVRKDTGDYCVTLKNQHGECSFTVKVTVIGQ